MLIKITLKNLLQKAKIKIVPKKLKKYLKKKLKIQNKKQTLNP